VCGVRHAPFRIYWYSFRMDDQAVGPKNYCGYCGAKMVGGRASRWNYFFSTLAASSSPVSLTVSSMAWM
jgi:hypothetical protein